MLRKLAFALLALGALGVACGDDTKPTTKKETGVKLPEAGTPGKEAGGPGLEAGTPGKEAGTPGKEAGTPAAGFGDKCTGKCTDPSMTCVVTKTGATDGFCSVECPVADFGTKPCTGGPTGTMPYCIFGDKLPTPTKAYCGFVCQAKDSTGKTITAPCPTQLKCGTPDANGNAVCEP